MGSAFISIFSDCGRPSPGFLTIRDRSRLGSYCLRKRRDNGTRSDSNSQRSSTGPLPTCSELMQKSRSGATTFA